ncbi:MAG: DUF3810 domain-containing protein [Oscillospiraceae bacterium]|nr:DUF3810 domain-containing protein [Oscillospiraceae bacterium]
MRKSVKIPIFYIVILTIILTSVCLNVLARLSTPFADYYVEKIFPIISTPFAWLVGLVPFSIGEILIALAVLILLVGVPILILILVLKRNNKAFTDKLSDISLRFISVCIAYVCLALTLNCFIAYQCSDFNSKYLPKSERSEELLLEALEAVTVKINELHSKFEREEDGYIIYNESYIDDCKKAMQNISKEYSQLSGYYPDPKPIISSYFMAQQGTIGLYMPFAFEATYNNDIQPISKPCTICHELAHLKGFMKEDEASFVAMVACFNSDNEFVQYSGYLDAFYYLYKNAKQLVGTKYEDDFYKAISALPYEYINFDLYSFKDDYFEQNKDKEILPTETVEAVSKSFTDATLKLNDVYDGIQSYNRVTELLMDYYANGKNH